MKTYVDELQDKAAELVLEALRGEYYDTADEAIEDFHQSLLNREWPDDICGGCTWRVEYCICP